MKNRCVKIFGERNTSTNALKELIESNEIATVFHGGARTISPASFRVARLLTTLEKALGRQQYPLREWAMDFAFKGCKASNAWKHTCTDFEDVSDLAGHIVLVCVRHPSSWLLALHRRPYHALSQPPKSFEGFLEMSWKTLGRDRTERKVLTPPELYNRKIKGYFELLDAIESVGGQFAFVRFEDFAIDQVSVLRGLPFGPEIEGKDIQPVRKSTKDPSKDHNYYRNYYGNELWRADISSDAQNMIIDAIDWEQLKPFRYIP